MAPSIPPHPPRKVRKKLEEVSKATGLSEDELWSRQSIATRFIAWKAIFLAWWASISFRKQAALKNNWKFWGRPAQQTPMGQWFIWLILAGRGWGKTRTGASWVIEMARKHPRKIGMLMGATSADIRDTMIYGDSGILASAPPDFMPVYEPSKCWVTFPNGCRLICRSAEKPDRIRGPNLVFAWVDELAAFRFLENAWDMLMMCTRRGNPQICITTTPRPLPMLIKMVKKAEAGKGGITLTRGSSWDNYWILAKRWFKRVVENAQGALARQEIWAEILTNVEGALWTFTQIWALEVPRPPVDLEEIAVGVDPPLEFTSKHDECGIVAVGRGSDQHGYVLEDASRRGEPHEWARTAYELWLRLEADVIVVETNVGGAMVKPTILSAVKKGEPIPRIVEVKATKSKGYRATPIAALWGVKRFHCVGKMAKLESEMCTFVPGVTKKSPNRLDAKVWAARHLFPSYRMAEAS